MKLNELTDLIRDNEIRVIDHDGNVLTSYDGKGSFLDLRYYTYKVRSAWAASDVLYVEISDDQE